MSNTTDWYNRNADKCFKLYTSNAVNMAPYYQRFLAGLEIGSRILDLGCGVGRDADYFIKSGYDVVAVDQSEEMAALALANFNVNVEVMDMFDYLQGGETFDAVWACASLVHLTPNEMRHALSLIFQSLEEGGRFWFCVKSRGEQEEGRPFHFYSNSLLELLIQEAAELSRRPFSYETDLVHSQGQSTVWLNCFIQM